MACPDGLPVHTERLCPPVHAMLAQAVGFPAELLAHTFGEQYTMYREERRLLGDVLREAVGRTAKPWEEE